MKSRMFLLSVLALSILGLLSGSIQQTAEQLYQSGIYKEEVEGELEKAIEIYEQILEDFPENQAIAAKALYHIGLCYEKLGNQEAQKAYQRLIEEYPGQIQEVNLARERLASLAKYVEVVPHKPTFRKIQIPTRLSRSTQLSPDGQKVSIVSSDGRLWIMPLSGRLGPDFPGTPVKLNTDDVSVDYSAHTWSRDGKWIAFNADVPVEEMQKKENKGNQGIYVVSSEGGKPKKVHENYRDARFINYRMSLSPNGKILAFSSVDIERKEQHIYTILVDGGEPKQLVETQAREPVFSPDGKMIAYVEDKDVGVEGGSLWVVPAQGGIPKRVDEAKKASSPIWSPEGDMIAFLDYGGKRNQIHIVPMSENDGVAGEKVTIDVPEGIENVLLLTGWTPENKIGAIFGKPTEFGLYTLPAEGGKATIVSYGGYPTKPRWSPDGKHIFHTNIADKGSDAWQELAVSVVPAEGGKVSTVPIQSDVKIDVPAVGGGNEISPDGRLIVFPENYGKHIWTLPVEGGKPNQLTKAPESYADLFPCWSPDGKAVAFVRFRVSKNYVEGFKKPNIFIVNSTGGEPKPLTSDSHKVFTSPIAWSPDGRLLAYFSRDENSSDGTLNVIPSDGGEPRALGKVKGIYMNKELAWSPDSKRIAFNSSEYDDHELISEGIKVISIDDGNISDIETGLVDTRIYHLDWSHDGKRLVFAGYKGQGREFWLMEDFLPLVKRQK